MLQVGTTIRGLPTYNPNSNGNKISHSPSDLSMYSYSLCSWSERTDKQLIIPSHINTGTCISMTYCPLTNKT